MQSNHHGSNGKGRVSFWMALSVALAMAPAALADPTESVLHSIADRCGVGRIVLTAFDIGLDVDRRKSAGHHGPSQ
jgi:hypothetical protein